MRIEESESESEGAIEEAKAVPFQVGVLAGTVDGRAER